MTDSPLVGTEWRVETIDGQEVIDRSRITVGFPEPGRVAGNGGCNRYSGAVQIDDDGISFGRLGGTLMACPPPIMDQDRRFQQMLAKVTRWEIGEAELLHLLDAKGNELVQATRVKKATRDG